ncbi:hypothetical protein [Vibrio sp. 1180_3]|uniref:hypothetical protein n=1 Tax=Vibrio sp. 1180_3 TaxID=2528832 RepID=UPI002405D66B|nr:hypothetical protein [Vibrio sp. 1180_3]MDF9399117.1 hypothetical protein [Vibrio sp. 1180_3]
MQQHIVNLYTDLNQITEGAGETIVNIIWTVNFNLDLAHYFNKRKYKHDLNLLKNGVGQLKIKIPDYTSEKYIAKSKAYLLAYAEAIAAKHLVANSGVNVFGFTYSDDGMVMTIRRDQLLFKLSQPDAVKHLHRKNVDQQFFTDYDAISNMTTTAAGYLYGASFVEELDPEWVKPHLEPGASFDYYNSAQELDIRSAETVFTSIGEVIINYRSVEEVMSNPWTRYQMETKEQFEPRAFDSVSKMVKSATQVIYENDSYLDKIRRKFGDKCFLLYDPQTHTAFPIKPTKDGSSEIYHMIGMKKRIKKEQLEEMQSKGYGLEFAKKESKEPNKTNTPVKFNFQSSKN